MSRRAHVAASDGHPLEAGRVRKTHPRDCGRPRCNLCNPSKLYRGADRARERREALRLEDRAA
ncbi:MAG: hypothetical protein JWM06_1674 [Actinomycetia bacterium]|nr:hypothetical protein [Actinomycetes bacterium]